MIEFLLNPNNFDNIVDPSELKTAMSNPNYLVEFSKDNASVDVFIFDGLHNISFSQPTILNKEKETLSFSHKVDYFYYDSKKEIFNKIFNKLLSCVKRKEVEIGDVQKAPE